MENEKGIWIFTGKPLLVKIFFISYYYFTIKRTSLGIFTSLFKTMLNLLKALLPFDKNERIGKKSFVFLILIFFLGDFRFYFKFHWEIITYP